MIGEVPLSLIPDEFKMPRGTEVPFDMLSDELKPKKGLVGRVIDKAFPPLPYLFGQREEPQEFPVEVPSASELPTELAVSHVPVMGKPLPRTQIVPELRTLKEPTEPVPIVERGLFELLGMMPVRRRPIFKKEGISKDQIIRSQNIMAMAKETNLPPTFIEQNYDNFTKKLGMRGIPTKGEMVQLLMTAGIGAGLITVPVGTIAGLGTFLGIKEAESLATQIAKGEKPKPLQGRELKEFLGPLDERQSLIVDTMEFMIPGLLGAQVMSKVKGKLTEKLSKKIIDEAWDSYVEKQSKNLIEYKGKGLPPAGEAPKPTGIPPIPLPVPSAKVPGVPIGRPVDVTTRGIVSKVPPIPEAVRPVVKGKEVPLEMVPEELVKPEAKVVRPSILEEIVRKDMEEAAKLPPEEFPILKMEIPPKIKPEAKVEVPAEITVGLAKPRKPEKFQDITRWVIKQGGVKPDDPNIDPVGWSRKQGGPIGLVSKKARYGLDELATLLPEAGFPKMTTDELSEVISNRVTGGKAPRGYTEAEIARLEDEWNQEHMDILDSDPQTEIRLLKPETKNTLTKSLDDEIMGLKEEWRERGIPESRIESAIQKAYKIAQDQGIIEKPEAIRETFQKPAEELVLPSEIQQIQKEIGITEPKLPLGERVAKLERAGFPEEATKLRGTPSPIMKGETLLPGMKIGLEMKGGKGGVTPTFEGTPLMEAGRKEEIERVQPGLFKKLTPGKTISQFTQEYREGLGEGGFIKVGGVEKVTPKVVVPGTKDVSLLEFPLTTLHVADRHPVLAPIIKGNIKAEQNTNNWILRHSNKISDAFDKVEKPSVLTTIFGRRGTNIKDLDLMIEGKKPIPIPWIGFVTEIKGILGGIKGEVIQKMKNDFAESLSPKQKEYLSWVEGGRVGDKPKYVRTGTIKAVDEARTQFKEMESWGIQDYFPHIFKGRYKYLNENGGIIASGQTAKQAKANFEEYVESHPETTDKTFMFVNDFYDLLTIRKVLNPELTSPLEYLGTRLSRREFFRLLGRTEKVIKEEIANAGVEDIPKVNVDMSGIASFQKGTKFSGHFLQRKTSLRGEETDPFRALMSYVFSVGRKLGLEDAKKTSYAFADSLPANMPNAKNYIKMQADNMSGRYNIIDRLFDETIGEKLGMKPFGVTRIFAKGVGLESKLKLGYAPAKTAINRMDAVFHIVFKEGAKNYLEGRELLKTKDTELMGRIEREGHLAGMEQLFAGEGLIGISKRETALWRPLGSYQWAEVKNRSEGLAAGYVSGLKKFNGDKDAAWIYALDSSNLCNGLYSTAAKPVLVRGPVAQASYQFKQFLNNRIRFMSTLTPAQWAVYIPGIVAVAGTRGALLTIKSIIGISIVGIGIDEVMERLNRKAPRLHRGIFGLIGFDVSAPASWQIPTRVKDWIGAFPNDVISTGEMIIKGLKNKGWTDEQINDYVRQIAPVGYNVFKGLQMLSEGVTKEGTKVIYRGGKEEGVINLTGAKSVSQSQASDSARYMNQQRQLLLEKSKVLEDKLFGSKSNEEANDIFKEFVELKNIQTPEELQNLINGLRQSAKSRVLTEEARIFMTLPKALKKEEIKRRSIPLESREKGGPVFPVTVSPSISNTTSITGLPPGIIGTKGILGGPELPQEEPEKKEEIRRR